jgi:hypothetical protein
LPERLHEEIYERRWRAFLRCAAFAASDADVNYLVSENNQGGYRLEAL